MLLESAVGFGCLYALDYIINSEKRELKNKWKMSMIYANAVNHKKNSQGKSDNQTFKIQKVIKKHYGYDVVVSIPFGLSYDELLKYKNVIETNLCCRTHFEKVKDSSSAYVRLITVPFDEKEPFKTVKTDKPTELYVGTTYYGKNIISDMRYHPHLIVSGATGTGKSFLLFTILFNLINNNDENDVNLYLAQISSKQDLRMFDGIRHTKYYANSLKNATKMYKYLKDEMDKRNKAIYRINGCNTIDDYNRIVCKANKDKKFPYIYIFADEFSFYMENGNETQDEMNQKRMCQNLLIDFIKEGRSAGIFVIVCLQRPDKENMPPIFKSQINTRIALRQNNIASSLVVIDCGDAVSLENREAIVLFGGERFTFKSLYLDKKIMKEMTNPYIDKNIKYVDLSEYEEEIKNSGKKKKEEKKTVLTINPTQTKPKASSIVKNIQTSQDDKKVKKGVIGSVSS